MCIKKSTTDTVSCMWKEVLKQNSLLKQMHNLTVYTMVQWNANVTFTIVTGSYLFPQIKKKKKSIHLEDSVAKRDLDWKLRETHRLSLEKQSPTVSPPFIYVFISKIPVWLLMFSYSFWKICFADQLRLIVFLKHSI